MRRSLVLLHLFRLDAERVDLLLVLLVVAGNLLLLALPWSLLPLRVLLGLPFVLFAPGYALQAALDPTRRLGGTERLVLSLGISLAVLVPGGLLLNGAPGGLGRPTWTVLLTVVTCAACAVAWRRRDPSVRLGLPTVLLRRRETVAVLGALVLAGGAYGLSSASANQQRVGFSQLWLLPQESTTPMSVGLRSLELTPTDFHVEVVSGATTVLDTSVTLSPGQTWRTTLDPPDPQQPVDAVIYRDGSTDAPYRSVHLAAGASR